MLSTNNSSAATGKLENSVLVLEVKRQEDSLLMSVFARQDFVSTLRHYTQIRYHPEQIQKICREISFFLNEPPKPVPAEASLLDGLKKSGQLLWDQLLSKTVKDKLKNLHAQYLILSIDEDLMHIPWELLYTGDNFLCLKFNLGRVISTRVMHTAPIYRSRPKVPRMLILANPTGDLKRAYCEGIDIRNRFDKIRRSIGIDFKSTNIDTVYVKKNLRDYDIVHFSGHSECDGDDPGASGWILADGKFSARDIRALGETLSMPSIVFSNACHSAQDRMYSLAKAFLFSGVRHYIGTMRRIEDDESVILAGCFYDHLISGKSVGESLRLARQKVFGCGMGSRALWAGYILYGDPEFVQFGSTPRLKQINFGKNFAQHKRKLALASIFFALGLILVLAFFWFPTLNPCTYILFTRSQKLFLAGNNARVISLGRGIIEKDPLFLEEYPLLAGTYQRLADKENALKCYFDYIRYSEKKKDLNNLASAYTGAGWMYYLFGEYAKAKEFYDRSLALSRQNHDKLNEADVMGKLAVWHMDNSENDLALELLTKSAEINRQRQHIYRHKYNLACDYFNTGLVFANKNDYLSAREFYDKSFKLFSELRMVHELSDYYFNIGEIYSFRKEYQKGIDCYNKGLAIDIKLGNKFNLPGDYNMFGELFLEMDDLSESESYFNRAIEAAKATGNSLELACSYYDLAQLYRKKGNKAKIKEYIQLASEIYTSFDQDGLRKIKEEFPEYLPAKK